MKVVVASESALKLKACQDAFAHMDGVEIVTFDANSDVNEQPVGAEIFRGAQNRIAHAMREVADGDVYVAIENGIFCIDGNYVDRALVVLRLAGNTDYRVEVYTDDVVIPADWVEHVDEARQRGFETTTVAEVLAERGLISNAKDPHLEISGTPRAKYIETALKKAVALAKL